MLIFKKNPTIEIYLLYNCYTVFMLLEYFQSLLLYVITIS